MVDPLPFDALARARLSRRDILRGSAALAAAFSLPAGCAAPRKSDPSTLRFEGLAQGVDDRMHVAAGHSAQVVLAWGDPVLPGAPRFSVASQSAETQRLQFGTENDFLAFVPLPMGSNSSTRGLLCANHEGSRLHMMMPGFAGEAEALARATRAQVECEMSAQGHSVVEIELVDGRWTPVPGSALNRRFDALHTVLRVSGPAAGSERLRTREDPSGTRVTGTFNNCAGGVTPWGTVLVCEENINQVFSGSARGTREARNHDRMGVGAELEYAWAAHHERFVVERELNEANRHGWVVEYDPHDPSFEPVKRTALGRFKHEGATCAVDPDGRVVVYMGDDDEDEHIYRWTSARAWNPNERAANRDLLDDGVLHVARFDEDGTIEWLPLVHGHGPLDGSNGFESQADVLIEARTAATLLGATPMDRPEDVEANPRTGKVYAMLTNNTRRKEADAANPRARNKHGHVLELDPPRDRQGRALHAADKFAWEVFLLGGDPNDAEQPGEYHAGVDAGGWLTCPDNCTFDPRGRLWIATDGGARLGIADGVWACDVDGEGRALTKRFFRAPVGAEVCGPCFTPDGSTLFVAVQHPGESDARGNARGVHHGAPTSRFPDHDPALPPRSAVVALRRIDGGALGG
jgi:secreted PhoX family phosphatase